MKLRVVLRFIPLVFCAVLAATATFATTKKQFRKVAPAEKPELPESRLLSVVGKARERHPDRASFRELSH
jgi:hypothetical protein